MIQECAGWLPAGARRCAWWTPASGCSCHRPLPLLPLHPASASSSVASHPHPHPPGYPTCVYPFAATRQRNALTREFKFGHVTAMHTEQYKPGPAEGSSVCLVHTHTFWHLHMSTCSRLRPKVLLQCLRRRTSCRLGFRLPSASCWQASAPHRFPPPCRPRQCCVRMAAALSAAAVRRGPQAALRRAQLAAQLWVAAQIRLKHPAAGANIRMSGWM